MNTSLLPHLLLLLLAHAAPSFAAECTAECSAEFVDKCAPYQCAKGGNGFSHTEAYDACRGELDKGGPGRLKNEGCVAECTDTTVMALEKTNDEDCKESSGAGDTGGGTGNGNSGSNDPDLECQVAVDVKHTSPTLCTDENKGCCACENDDSSKTYVLWIHNGTIQRCIHTYGVPTVDGTPKPVVLSMNGYGSGKINGGAKRAANKYGFAIVGVGSTSPKTATGFRLSFGNDGIANAANPTPCTEAENRDKPYTDAIFAWIEAQGDTRLDAKAVYAEGFSQESMYAAYVSVCYADKVKGLWQGGSGLSKAGHTPVVPGFQGQCSLTSFTEHKQDCCTASATSFCKDCAWWPIYPRTCSNKLVDCIMAYTDDAIGCGSDYYMYEAMTAEGNDARLLSFAGGQHSNPKNEWDWKVGCLGITDSCSSDCEASFAACVDDETAGTGDVKFAACDEKKQAGTLASCTTSCAPTIGMLKLSENPVYTLSGGKFGTQSGLSNSNGQAGTAAPRPACKVPFGDFATAPHRQCTPATGSVTPPTNIMACGTPDPVECDTVCSRRQRGRRPA